MKDIYNFCLNDECTVTRPVPISFIEDYLDSFAWI